MKRTIILMSLLAAGTAFAQQAEIDKALAAAPDQLKKDATVIKWKSDYTYDTLKKARIAWSATTSRDCPESRPTRSSAPALATSTARRKI